MPNQKALVLTSGRVAQIVSTDNLIVGSGVDTATAATLSIGASTASAISIGKSGQTTTLTNGATFGGNLAFANSPATPWVGVLTVGSYSINVSSAVQCTVSVTHDAGIPAPTVIIDTDTPSSVIARYGTGTTAGQLATALDGTAALSANAAISGPLPTTGGFYSVTTSGGSAGGTAYRATNLLDPSSAQDAATKNYVDTQTVLSFSGGSTGLTPSTATKGAITLAGTLAAANGGTGQSSYAVGELLYASGTTALSKLATVATGNALLSAGAAAPQWGKVGLTTHVSGTLGVGNGGTGTATAFTQGSVVFAGASGVYSQNNANLFWSDANIRLGVGTAAPTGPLHVVPSTALAAAAGGPITLTAQSGGTGNTNGGNVVITAGAGSGTGSGGQITLTSGNTGTGAIGNIILSTGNTGSGAGTVIVRAGVDTPLMFRVQNVSLTNVFTVDTLNSRVLCASLRAGSSSQFQVDSTGDIVAIRGQTTTFPAANAAGVLTNNGTGTLSWSTASGGAVQAITTLTGATTLTTSNYTALCNGTFTVTLPLATGNTGRAYEIKNVGTGTITISGNGGTIDGAATYVMDTQYQAVIVRCDGTNWFIF